MAVDVERIGSKCQSCARHNPTHCNKRKLLLLSAARPLELVAIDIIETFPKRKQHNQHILVITDRHSNIAREIPTSKTTSTHIASHFFGSWFIPYVTPTYLLTKNSVQCIRKLFSTLCTLLGV